MITGTELLTYLFTATGILIWSIFLHEIGHKVYFQEKFNRRIDIIFHISFTKSYIQTGEFKDYVGTTFKDLKYMYLMGIIFGITPIIFSIFHLSYYYSLLLLPYLFGCRSDFRKMFKRDN